MIKIDDFYRGDTVAYKITTVNDNNAPVDITGNTYTFTIKEDVEQSDKFSPYQIRIEPSAADAIQGVFWIYIPASISKKLKVQRYHYDVEMNQNGMITTLTFGNFKVKSDVTRGS